MAVPLDEPGQLARAFFAPDFGPARPELRRDRARGEAATACLPNRARGPSFRPVMTARCGRYAAVAQLVRAPDCGSGGRRFESRQLYQVSGLVTGSLIAFSRLDGVIARDSTRTAVSPAPRLNSGLCLRRSARQSARCYLKATGIHRLLTGISSQSDRPGSLSAVAPAAQDLMAPSPSSRAVRGQRLRWPYRLKDRKHECGGEAEQKNSGE